MPEAWIVLIIGIFFLIVGVGAIIWGAAEKRHYYEAISTRYDLREFVERSPEQPEPGSLQIGGIISLVIASLLLIFGFILL